MYIADIELVLRNNIIGAFQVALVVKNTPKNDGDIRDVSLTLGGEDPLEECMATHCSMLAWKTHGQRTLGGYSS